MALRRAIRIHRVAVAVVDMVGAEMICPYCCEYADWVSPSNGGCRECSRSIKESEISGYDYPYKDSEDEDQ